MAENPVLVEVRRGPLVESTHRGAAIVCDARGKIVAAWGDVARPVYPRSAVKPLQAIALVETGAADKFSLSEAELALSCASHNGSPEHVAAVGAWLTKMGLSGSDLECGAHVPSGADAAMALACAGEKPTRLHNNCSGKHAGMLATALATGDAPHGYSDADHAVQRRTRAVMGEMAGEDLDRAPMGIDGCGIPTVAMSLAGLARAMARIAAPDSLASARREAVLRIRRAVAAHPFMVAGRGRFCTTIMEAAGEAILVKTGAEGVFAAALPSQGLGIALKIDDGATRASECATAALVRRFGAITGAADAALAAYAQIELRNWSGTVVGSLAAAPALLAET
ncbi:MAG: asparaginase [Alphaproteobacteria bacterium]|nr:asparaginase [Alphaproteobacteria bacterium]